jgi:hypothetical protein
MQLNRINVSADSRNKLSILKGRTGLLPNVLCRLGSVLLLAEFLSPSLEGVKEFLGSFYTFFIRLMSNENHY